MLRVPSYSGAWPFAYFVMHKWLGNFAYCIGIGWDIFVFSGITAGVVAEISVRWVCCVTSSLFSSL